MYQMSNLELFCDFWICVLYTSIFILLFYHIRKKLMKLRLISVRAICFIYFLCLLRLLLPFEAPWAICITSRIFNPIMDFMFFRRISFGHHSLYFYQILFTLYVTISIFLLLRLLFSYTVVSAQTRKKSLDPSDKAYRFLSDIQDDYSTSLNIKLYELDNLNSPLSTGLLRKCIILPASYSTLYSDEQLHFILRHEYNHLKNRDCFSKLLANVVVCLFFWNPCVYIFRKDIEQSMELRCDQMTLDGLTDNKRLQYLETMLLVIKNQNTLKASRSSLSERCALKLVSNYPVDLKERFLVISKKHYAHSFFKDLVVYTFAATLFISSYTVFFSSHYDPPLDDIEPDCACHEIDPTTDTLVIDDSDCYILLNDGSTLSVSGNAIQLWEENGGRVIRK